MWTKLKGQKYLLFELFIFVRVTGMYMSKIAQNLIIQDKICIYGYNQSVNFCENIHEIQVPALESVKDHVLADSSQFANYIYILQCVPMFIWSLFIGSFMDLFKYGTIVILLNCVIGDILMVVLYMGNVYFYSASPDYLFITTASFWTTGGMACYLVAAYKYIITNSNEAMRSLKFLFIEVALIMGISFGTYVGGQLLTVKPEPTPQMRTYFRNFVGNLVLDLIALVMLYLVYRMDKSQEKQLEEMANENTETSVLMGSSDVNNNYNYESIKPNVASESQTESQSSERRSVRQLLGILFNLGNIRETFYCVIKPRENNTRMQIYTMFVILSFNIFVLFGINNIEFQFTEKVYNWNSEQYTMYAAIGQIIGTTLMAVVTIFLLQKFGVRDGPMIIVAHVSSFFSYGATGTFLNPLSYFIAIPIGALTPFGIISTRSKMSKVVPGNEVGKIFSIIATLETLVPIAGSSAYTTIFAASISNYPGLIYQFGAALIIISMAVAVFEELKFRPKTIDIHES